MHTLHIYSRYIKIVLILVSFLGTMFLSPVASFGQYDWGNPLGLPQDTPSYQTPPGGESPIITNSGGNPDGPSDTTNIGGGGLFTESLSNDPFTPDPCSMTYVAGSGLGGFVDMAACFMTNIIPLLITAAVVVFLYGMVVYIYNADNQEKRAEGNMFILSGLIALFVIVSMWALVGVLSSSFGLGVVIPQLQE
jgi:cbb3-type cytochrome oxidase subunit 3